MDVGHVKRAPNDGFLLNASKNLEYSQISRALSRDAFHAALLASVRSSIIHESDVCRFFKKRDTKPLLAGKLQPDKKLKLLSAYDSLHSFPFLAFLRSF